MINFLKRKYKILFILILSITLSQPAYAYLDPGTGSLILQALIGAFAAAATVISVYWNKFKNFYNHIIKNIFVSNKKNNKE